MSEQATFACENFTLPTVRSRNLLWWDGENMRFTVYLGPTHQERGSQLFSGFPSPQWSPGSHICLLKQEQPAQWRIHFFVCANVWECWTTQKCEILNVCLLLFAPSNHFHWLQRKTELGNSTCYLGIFIWKISKNHDFIVSELSLLCNYLLPPTLFHISVKNFK